MNSSSPFILDVTAESFERDVVENSRRAPVLVDFWAAWCGPCQMLIPTLHRLAEAYGGEFLLAKVNIDEQPALAQRFAVRSVPTVKLFRHGQPVEEFLGVRPEGEIRALIERYVERESDRIVAAAHDAFLGGRQEQAMEMLRKLLAEEPAHHGARIELAEMRLADGRLAEAEELLRALPADVRAEERVQILLTRLEFARVAEGAPDAETLQGQLAADPARSEARYQLAARRVAAGDYEGAMEELLELLRRDRGFGDDIARKSLVRLFEMLGGKGELVTRYRSRMFNALH